MREVFIGAAKLTYQDSGKISVGTPGSREIWPTRTFAARNESLAIALAQSTKHR